MRSLALAALLLAPAALAAPIETAPASGLRDLTAGRYELKISGFLCAACLRAVAAELSRYPSVAKAEPDVAGEGVRVAVKPNEVLRVPQIKKALRKASSLANLGAHYDVAAVRYELTPLTPAVAPTPKKK